MNPPEKDESSESYAARILADMAERWEIDHPTLKALIYHLEFLVKENAK